MTLGGMGHVGGSVHAQVVIASPPYQSRQRRFLEPVRADHILPGQQKTRLNGGLRNPSHRDVLHGRSH